MAACWKHKAVTSRVDIDWSTYRADGHGGVPVGTHVIQIEAYRKSSTPPPPNVPRFPGEPEEQYLPKEFNENSNLEITIPSGSPAIIKDFDLTDS